MRRRWPLTLVLLLCVAGACFGATRLVPPDYEAKATFTLIPPASLDNPAANRYLLLGGMTPARDIVIRSLAAKDFAEPITADIADARFEVAQDFATSAPMVVVTATAPTPGGAREVIERVLGSVPTLLDTLQNELRTANGSRITSLVVSEDTKAERAGKAQIRAVLAAGGLVGLLGAVLITVVDQRRLRRQALPTAEPAASSSAPGPPAADPAQMQPVARPVSKAVSRAVSRAGSKQISDQEPNATRTSKAKTKTNAGSELEPTPTPLPVPSSSKPG